MIGNPALSDARTRARLNARQFFLWVLAAVAAVVTAIGITRPHVGVAVIALLIAVYLVRRGLRNPMFALEMTLCVFPVYPVFRALVGVYNLPIPSQGLRFWPELLLSLAFFGIMLHAIRRRRMGERNPLALTRNDIPVLLYITYGAYGVSLTGPTRHPYFLVFGFHYVLLPILFYLVTRWLRPTEKETKRLVFLFLLTYSLLALASLVDFFHRTDLSAQLANASRPQLAEGYPDPILFWRTYLRMQGLVYDENVWGALSSFVSLICMAAFAVDRRAFRRFFPVWLLATICLGFSTSRGAFVGWIVGTLALLLQRGRYRGRILLLLGGVVLTVILVALKFQSDPRIQVWQILIHQSGVMNGKVASDRWFQWQAGYNIFTAFPSGTGIGTVGYGASATGQSMTTVADGNYVSSLAEEGIPGVILLISLFLSVFIVLIRLRARDDGSRSPFLYGLGSALVASFTATLVHAYSANTLEYYWTYQIFWMLFGAYVNAVESQSVSVSTEANTSTALVRVPRPGASS